MVCSVYWLIDRKPYKNDDDKEVQYKTVRLICHPNRGIYLNN